MRILVVSNGYPPRGAFGTEFYTRELVRALARRGHAPTVLHPERGGARSRYELEGVLEDGVPVFLLHNAGDAAKRFRSSYRDEEVERVFAELLARERPDVVHFTYLLWGLSLRLPEVARAAGVPSVATLTDYGLLCHRGQMFDATLARCGGPHPPAVCARCIRTPLSSEHAPLARVARGAAAEGLALLGGLGRVPVTADLVEREGEVRRALDALARLIAPTRGLLETFARAGVARDKLVPLTYSFDEQPYQAFRAVPAPKTVRFGFLGQFAPHKGLACLLAAARLLERADPRAEWELVLHGAPSAGRHRRYALAQLASLDGRRVRREPSFAPDEAPRVLSGLSALVAPSEWDENAPLAVLQARALGLPVIATDVPGIAEIVAAPAQGRLVPVGDARALAEAMGAVVRGEFARPLAPGLPLALDAHVTRLEQLYAAVLAESAHG
ncbi:MAG: glycosyltransferase [Planctomycetes bacterium]|nr:glycosyltransferase [Planctomycetota bacterium]